MSELQKLLTYLEVKRVDTYLFTGRSPSSARPNLRRAGPRPEPQCRQSLRGGRACRTLIARLLPAPRQSRRSRSYSRSIPRATVAASPPAAWSRSRTASRSSSPPCPTRTSRTASSTRRHARGHRAGTAADGLRVLAEMAQKHPDRFDPPITQALERRVVRRRDYIDPQPEDPSSICGSACPATSATTPTDTRR
jgi:acyl-CoA thioesterase-2